MRGRLLLLLSLLAAVGAFTGCGSIPARQAEDVRGALLASAKAGDPDFPDGRAMKLTHFSHVGELSTSRGEAIHVADRRAVITGMLAPRGRNFITFFDSDYRYLGKVGYVQSRPLWCEGSRLYLHGALDGFATGLEGNIIDLSDGFGNLTAHHASEYGSSGGVED